MENMMSGENRRAYQPGGFNLSYGVPVSGMLLMGVKVAVGRKVPGPGVMGVLVGGRVAVGVTRLTGICKI